MRALSIRQPWAWLIVSGYKSLENRGWTTEYKGPLLLHASKSMTRQEYDDACSTAKSIGGVELLRRIPAPADLEKGGIVGECQLTGWVAESDDPWFFGPYALRLEQAKRLPFRPWRGALGFFDVPRSALTPNVELERTGAGARDMTNCTRLDAFCHNPRDCEAFGCYRWSAWPKCAVPACGNKSCRALRSKYCWPHTPGDALTAQQNLLETEIRGREDVRAL